MDQAGSRPTEQPNLYIRCLTTVLGWACRRPWWTIALALVVTLITGLYALENVKINSDDSALISQDEPFRRDYQNFIDAFPQFDETTLIVITSDSIDLADGAAEILTAALEKREDLVDTLYSPSADPFFENHALLYMDIVDLEEVIERLAEAQPALTALSEDPSLRGLFDQLETSVTEMAEGEELPGGFVRMADRVSQITEQLLAGDPRKISWADEFLGEDGDVYRIIVVQGRKRFDQAIATDYLISEIRKLASDLGITEDRGIRLRLTGMVPLANDEQLSLQNGLFLAGLISGTLLIVILGFGVRSLRIIVATFASLSASLVWTTAWAMWTVGEFNIISAAFGVLMIGLGVDFAIHIGLRYEEECRFDRAPVAALRRASEGVGGPVSLCALTSAVGFLSFIPTPYPGLAALGVIAGGGMFIAFFASFTLFPAVLVVMRAPTRQHSESPPLLSRIHPMVEAHAGKIVVLAGLVGLGGLALATQMRFDFNTLSMRDPSSESLVTLRELQEEKIVTDYSATFLVPDLESSERIAARLEGLKEVVEARPPSYFVPGEQDTKLYMIEDAAFFLEPVLNPPPAMEPPTSGQRMQALNELRSAIERLSPDDPKDPAALSAQRLGSALELLTQGPDPVGQAADLEDLVISDLQERIEWLKRAITVGPVEFEDLPEAHRARSVSSEGLVRVTALPREDVRDTDALRRFVEAVVSVDPAATGRPVVEVGIGQLVVMTFRLALFLAVTIVSLVLLATLRSPLGVLLVLFPITLSALVTTAAGVVFDLPFNLANVVVIPLIMGLGIDNGIHVYMRYREGASIERMMDSSTPRAVLISAMTTLAAFGSLAISGHQGLKSLGILLSVSLICVIIGTLIVLPATISVLERRKHRWPSPPEP